MPNYNTRLIKSRRSYNITEMASLLGVDRKTCQRWIKQDGLKVIEKGVNPLLIMGADLISFLREKKEQRRCELREDEFFCMKCRRAVKARVGSEEVVKTGKKIGKNDSEQFKKTGFCEVCNTGLNRFLRGQGQD